MKFSADSSVPWALVISTFINKSGEMAMSLLPMLLIERNFTTAGASFALGLTKAAQVVGLFFGGLLCDYFGFRYLILASYLAGAIGFTSLPFLSSTLMITIFAVFAQFGAALFNASARSLIREKGGPALKQNMAWLRTSSNLGQVISSLLGIIFGSLGLIFPFILDGITSFIAFAIGIFTLKNPKPNAENQVEAVVQKGYFLYSFALAFFYFAYELGILSFSGFAKLSLGGQSIQAFSIVVLVNSFFCGILAVPAARLFKNPKKALFLGVFIISVGMLFLVLLPKTIPYFALCSAIMTCGEIVFSVYAQTLLLVNSTGKSGKHYGVALMIQTLGRLAAGVCVFPLVLRSEHPELPFLFAPVLFVLVFSFLPKAFIQRASVP